MLNFLFRCLETFNATALLWLYFLCSSVPILEEYKIAYTFYTYVVIAPLLTLLFLYLAKFKGTDYVDVSEVITNDGPALWLLNWYIWMIPVVALLVISDYPLVGCIMTAIIAYTTFLRYLNPVLGFMGYRKYTVASKGGDVCTLLSKKYYSYYSKDMDIRYIKAKRLNNSTWIEL